LTVIDDLAELGCKTLNLSGGGEPTIHPEFGLILRKAAALKLRTWVVTHGGLLLKWMQDLLFADHIRISLDASNAAEHKTMHGTKDGEFERVCQNVKFLCRAAKHIENSPRPEVGLAYIVADVNCSDASLMRVFRFAKEAGVDFLHFRPLSEDSPSRFTKDWQDIAFNIENIAQAFPEVAVFPVAKRWREIFTQREFSRCYSALTAAVIGATGEVSACCDRRDLVMGNVNEKSFKEIWLSSEHREKAAKIVPKLCSRCLQSSFNRSVERYIVNNEALPELV
jgi:MoaA/NifB/PqqE/SkfB family radical SAM enzyme